ncbi:HAD superfamily hydrolase (TIGR01509 family) [Trinickia symbiotica]|uniref:HAD family phosphatase n=1 Tax=Trinickia symbiotica TaxID=863227 RepID=A0A2N7X2T3_9BURK|nr:HAD family phosphatase [Trinickia symbiotica]PMS35891.1 HAD family phosphatase [Trinickia symbiotica]PPK44458.1 HAD superfamily hydrolase (TIGR01509 family) [Trinickia symbiotica]
MFSAAIFDMDGLLIDSERTIMNTWIAAGRELGLDILPVDYVQIIGRSLPECHAMLATMFGAEAAFQEALKFVRQRLQSPTNPPVFPLKSGAHGLLTALVNAGVPCAVASSSSAQEIKSRLGRVGVLDLFDAIAGGDEVARGKPDPAVYELAASRLKKSPSECLAFEDSENGVRAAHRAGIQVVTVPDLKAPSEDLIGVSLTMLETLDHAMEHVAAWFGAETLPA